MLLIKLAACDRVVEQHVKVSCEHRKVIFMALKSSVR